MATIPRLINGTTQGAILLAIDVNTDTSNQLISANIGHYPHMATIPRLINATTQGAILLAIDVNTDTSTY